MQPEVIGSNVYVNPYGLFYACFYIFFNFFLYMVLQSSFLLQINKYFITLYNTNCLWYNLYYIHINFITTSVIQSSLEHKWFPVPTMWRKYSPLNTGNINKENITVLCKCVLKIFLMWCVYLNLDYICINKYSHLYTDTSGLGTNLSNNALYWTKRSFILDWESKKFILIASWTYIYPRLYNVGFL